MNASDKKIKLEFLPYEKQEYGFDKLTYDVHKDMYEQASVYGENVFLPWKSLAAASMDRVLVKFSDYDTTISPAKVQFRTNNGVALTSFEHEGKKDERLVLMNGGANQAAESIEAYVAYKDTSDKNQELVVGMYKTISYEKKNVNIVIVPVNGTTGFSVGDFTEALNDIYKQAAISWTVTLQSQFNIETDEWDENESGEAGYGKMNNTDGHSNRCYSYEQDNFIKKYKHERDIENKTYYVFLLNGIESENNWAGFMPLKNQVAFIYLGNTNTRTIAHELGHGAFRLRHTFDNENKYVVSQNSTDNLMDYNNGQRLHKYQWDYVQKPEAMIAWLQYAEEGAAMNGGTLLTANIADLINQIRQGNKDNKSELPIKITTGIGEYDKITLGNKDYSYIKMITAGFNPLTDSQTNERPSYEMKPSELNTSTFNENGTKFTKYQFHELQTTQHGAPYADTKETTGVTRIDICVKEVEQIAFENYLFGRDMPKPGDPLINMEIVGIISTSKIGGTYGCVRWTDDDDQKNCDEWVENITNFPTILDKNKVHDGIDLLAPIGTPVYAMFDGVATVAYSSKLGNFVLIESTQDEHNLLGIEEKIWCSYGHLNSYENIVGKVKQGQLIGYSGNTGTTASGIDSWRYHLHLTIYKGGTDKYNRVNPITFTTTKFDSNGNKIN